MTSFRIRVLPLHSPKVEIQSPDLKAISSFAANNISKKSLGMVAVEDSGLFVEALAGFPGPYSSQAHKTIGCPGILRLLGRGKQRNAYFQTAIAVSKSGRTLDVFTGKVNGKISWIERGDNGFGFDPIFIPAGSAITFGEMSETEKNRRSHRSTALRRLAKWYLAS